MDKRLGHRNPLRSFRYRHSRRQFGSTRLPKEMSFASTFKDNEPNGIEGYASEVRTDICLWVDRDNNMFLRMSRRFRVNPLRY